MRHSATRIGLLVLLVAMPTGAQQEPKEPVTLRNVLLEGWNDMGQKVVQLAENFPEEKYMDSLSSTTVSTVFCPLPRGSPRSRTGS